MLTKEPKECATLLVQTNFNFWKYLTKVSAATFMFTAAAAMLCRPWWGAIETGQCPIVETPPLPLIYLPYITRRQCHHSPITIAPSLLPVFRSCNWRKITHSTKIKDFSTFFNQFLTTQCLHFWPSSSFNENSLFCFFVGHLVKKRTRAVPALVLFNLDWLKTKVWTFEFLDILHLFPRALSPDFWGWWNFKQTFQSGWAWI